MTKRVKSKVSDQEDAAVLAAVDLIAGAGVDLSGLLKEGGLLKQLTKRLVERALQSEMSDHLGYNKYERVESDSDSARSDNTPSGASQKGLITDNGVITIDVPRDRKSTFEPAL